MAAVNALVDRANSRRPDPVHRSTAYTTAYVIMDVPTMFPWPTRKQWKQQIRITWDLTSQHLQNRTPTRLYLPVAYRSRSLAHPARYVTSTNETSLRITTSIYWPRDAAATLCHYPVVNKHRGLSRFTAVSATPSRPLSDWPYIAPESDRARGGRCGELGSVN